MRGERRHLESDGFLCSVHILAVKSEASWVSQPFLLYILFFNLLRRTTNITSCVPSLLHLIPLLPFRTAPRTPWRTRIVLAYHQSNQKNAYTRTYDALRLPMPVTIAHTVTHNNPRNGHGNNGTQHKNSNPWKKQPFPRPERFTRSPNRALHVTINTSRWYFTYMIHVQPL